MKMLFFDMEFANGKVPGSIYSLGYLMTDENFDIIRGPADILMNPDSEWNEYVKSHILAYPKETVEAAPKFPMLYQSLCALFDEADIAVGFAVNNDIRALRKNCERYGLEQIRFRALDMEKLCRKQEEYKEAHGLGGYVNAWCGEIPDNRHRSDGDALATMMLFRAICQAKHATAEMMLTVYPECCTSSLAVAKKVQKTPSKKKAGRVRRKKADSRT
ncbi:MAG: 3'-5' exonuclease [Clostridia bacterium]|nr:3'-5' exonuclease [Clostridia bacterium]MBQ3014862.1 3'-5' exonuclease [Clostridia bacterium]